MVVVGGGARITIATRLSCACRGDDTTTTPFSSPQERGYEAPKTTERRVSVLEVANRDHCSGSAAMQVLTGCKRAATKAMLCAG